MAGANPAKGSSLRAGVDQCCEVRVKRAGAVSVDAQKHPSKLHTMTHFAYMYFAQRRYDEAEPLF